MAHTIPLSPILFSLIAWPAAPLVHLPTRSPSFPLTHLRPYCITITIQTLKQGLGAAHWTLTSTKPQHLVSSAICQSAKAQSIRLLPPSIIDTHMHEDSTNIKHSWQTAAAQWCYGAQDRNMLLRTLSADGTDGDVLPNSAERSPISYSTHKTCSMR